MGNLTFGAWMMAPRLKMILGCAGVPRIPVLAWWDLVLPRFCCQTNSNLQKRSEVRKPKRFKKSIVQEVAWYFSAERPMVLIVTFAITEDRKAWQPRAKACQLRCLRLLASNATLLPEPATTYNTIYLRNKVILMICLYMPQNLVNFTNILMLLLPFTSIRTLDKLNQSLKPGSSTRKRGLRCKLLPI